MATRKKAKKKAKRKQPTMFNVVVGRLEKHKKVKVKPETTIEEALMKGRFRKAENEAIQDVNGNTYEGNEMVEDKCGYFLIQKVKSGSC